MTESTVRLSAFLLFFGSGRDQTVLSIPGVLLMSLLQPDIQKKHFGTISFLKKRI